MLLEAIPLERSGAGKDADVVRGKEYLKPGYPLRAYTPLPDVASRMLGCTWAQANRVAMVDSVGCNMRCVGCYQAGRSAESREVSAAEVAALFREVGDYTPVWRISGGEPTTQKDFQAVVESVSMVAGSDHVVWVNTNGLVGYEALGVTCYLNNVVVEVSLKGFCESMAQANTRLEGPVLSTQLDTVHSLLTEGANLLLNVYAAAPDAYAETMDVDQFRQAAECLMADLEAIDPTLPFRVTPVRVKAYEWWPEPDVTWACLADLWDQAMEKRYGVSNYVNLHTLPSAYLGLGTFSRPGGWN